MRRSWLKSWNPRVLPPPIPLNQDSLFLTMILCEWIHSVFISLYAMSIVGKFIHVEMNALFLFHFSSLPTSTSHNIAFYLK